MRNDKIILEATLQQPMYKLAIQNWFVQLYQMKNELSKFFLPNYVTCKF